MEKKFLKLGVILTLVISISAKSNANDILNKLDNVGKTIVGTFPNVKFTSSTGFVCDRYEIITFVGIENGKLVKATNFSEAFCGIKSSISIEWENGYCSCVEKLGLTDNLDNIITEDVKDAENIINKKSFFNKKALFTFGAFAWNAWNVWNNVNAILNYLGNKLKIDLGDLDIDLEGVL